MLFATIAIAGGAALGVLVVDRLPEATPEADVVVPTASARLTSDVEGDEIAQLPRYPGSVRTASVREQQGSMVVTSAEYVASAKLDDVRAFYRRIFRERDWDLVELDFATGEWIFLVERGARAALVEIESDGLRTVIDIETEKPIRAQNAVDPPPPPPPPPPPDDGDDGDDGDDDGDDGDDGD